MKITKPMMKPLFSCESMNAGTRADIEVWLTAATRGVIAVTTLDGLLGPECPPGPARLSCQLEAVYQTGGAFLVRVTPDAAGRASLGRLARAYPAAVNYPVPPTDLVNFGESVNFPLILGLVLIVFGVATLLHVLVVSVTRRRREMGLLKSLGFVRGQVAAMVWWQTTTAGSSPRWPSAPWPWPSYWPWDRQWWRPAPGRPACSAPSEPSRRRPVRAACPFPLPGGPPRAIRPGAVRWTRSP